MMASVIAPNTRNNRTTPSQAENGARARATSRRDGGWFSTISVDQAERFNQARIANRKQRRPTDHAQINEGEGRTDRDQRDKIPNTDVDAGAMQRREDN